MAIQYCINRKASIPQDALALFQPDTIERAQRFHATIPGYQPTPLVSLKTRARELGIAQLLVKDESCRFGLNAFKALGGSYAMARCIANMAGLADEDLSFAKVSAPEVRKRIGRLTFVTATDGNHGRGVAWAARLLGHDAVVLLPRGSSPERLESIRGEGARSEITDLNYDDAVRLANALAQENGWILVQDTTQPEYTDIPTWIMQGYATIVSEIEAQLATSEWQRPTHLFLQAGVGSFAGAMLGSFAAAWGTNCPATCIVEPDKADCLFRSAQAGRIVTVGGALDSMMAGLCCGEPCSIGWDILGCAATAFISCDDSYAAEGMRLLGRPLLGDLPLVSGESGAVCVGVLPAILRDEHLGELRCALALREDSRVLCISTEGDTDKENYRAVLTSN